MMDKKEKSYFIRYRFGTDQQFDSTICSEAELPVIFLDCVRRSDVVRFVVKRQRE